MPVLVFIAVFVGVAFALRSLPWFFSSGADTDRSLDAFCQNIWSPSALNPFFATKFGLWLMLSLGTGVGTYHLLVHGWSWVQALL